MIQENEKFKLTELDKADLAKYDENKEHVIRQQKQQKELEELIKEFKEHYFREYHFIYEYPYKKAKLGISCFKENEELKDNPYESNYLEKDYKDVYKDYKLLSEKNLQRYDCWEDKTPEEWVELCQNSELEEHGKSPNYYEGT